MVQGLTKGALKRGGSIVAIPPRADIRFMSGDLLERGSPYRVLNKDGAGGGSEEAAPLGIGGSGLVYRARQKDIMERAIKIVCPRDELRETQDSEQFLATYQAEVAILADVTHTRIAKIIDFGEADHPAGTLPYSVMEYIEGVEMQEVWTDPALSGRTFLDLFDHVLDALEYLHREAIMHCDVKGANVRVRGGGTDRAATLLDLGVAKVLKPFRGAMTPTVEAQPDLVAQDQIEYGGAVDGETDSADFTLFFSTRRITRPEWQDRIEREVSRDELAEMFPGHDLYAFGKLLDEALASDEVQAALQADLGAGILDAVRKIRDRLLLPLDQEYYPSAREVRGDWQKLRPGYLAPLEIAELAIGAAARTSLATPSGRVSITDRVYEIINHPLFQRLRLIPQLELASMVYPGATHTRFLHSLSIFDTSRRYVSHLLNDPAFRLLVGAREVEALILYALLHDIGHYPLSHMFEDFSEAERLAGSERTIPSDDELFWAFVAPEHASPEFRDYAESLIRPPGDGRESRESLSDLLARGGVRGGGLVSSETFDAMKRIHERTDPAACVLAAVLSSPIDADKVAYLTDDSLMSGVRYGLGIDLDALLAALRAPREEDIALGASVIAISDKGLTAAEGIVLARYWMLRRVYWHHTNRATIAMVKLVIERLLTKKQMTMREYFEAVLFADLPQALEWLDVRFAKARESGALGADEWVNPLEGLQGGSRGIYKRLVTVSRGTDPEGYEKLARASHAELSELAGALRGQLEEFGGRSVARGEVIIDVPMKVREPEADGGDQSVSARESREPREQVLVYLQVDPERPLPLEEASPVVGELRREFDAHAKKCRIFVHPDLFRAIEPRLLQATQAAAALVGVDQGEEEGA